MSSDKVFPREDVALVHLGTSQGRDGPPVGRIPRLARAVWDKKVCYLSLIPILAAIVWWFYYPIVSAFYHSFTRWDIVSSRWVGLANYRRMLGDRVFLRSLENVLVLMIGNLFTAVIPNLLGAELVFNLRSWRASQRYRLLLLIPTVLPPLVSILTWKLILDHRHGLINELLGAIGLGMLQHDWLGDFTTALPSLIFVGFPWVGGTFVLIYLSALLNIPGELLDAYALDGAGVLRRIWHVDRPFLMGAIKLGVVMSIMESLRGLGLQFTLTGGGPGIATNVPAYYMFTLAFEDGQFGYASAIGVLLFVLLVAFAVTSMRLMQSPLEYEPNQ